MAIISAGVIMNLIFAVIMATVAFQLGVERMEPVIGAVIPGGAAYQEDLRTGDRIMKIAGKPVDKFRDVLEHTSLGDDIDKGLRYEIERPGVAEPLIFVIKPDASGMMPVIGITNSLSTTIGESEMTTWPGSPAAAAKPGFKEGDKIIAINDTAIGNYRDLQAYMALHPEETLKYTVERSTDEGKDVKAEISTAVIEVAPRHMRRMGLVMEMGKISAVQKNSPAAKAGIQVGDMISKIDGQSPGDPMTLPGRLRRRAGKTIVLTVVREKGAKKPIDIKVTLTLRQADWLERPVMKGNPMSIPALGVAYAVLNRVHSTIAGSPADKAGLRPGDVITEATVIPPEKQDPAYEKLEQKEGTFELNKDHRNWPLLIYRLQEVLPDTTVTLKWKRQGKAKEATLGLVEVQDWFNPRRGILLQPLIFIQKGKNIGDSLRLGFEETCHATSMVYRFLQKLGNGQISLTALGGPVTIFRVAKQAASHGISSFLIFLTLLSANLAVLNFLPIPLLDGGHMVFLTWEGIRRKPASEGIQLVLTYFGLAFILALMVFVIGLDIDRWINGW